MSAEEYTFDAEQLSTVESAHAALSLCLQKSTPQELEAYMQETNRKSKSSLQNLPYLITEFLTSTSSWGLGLLLGRWFKYTLYPDADKAEVEQVLEKLFIPISLLLAFLFNEESRRYTKAYQNWQTCISSLRDRVMYVYYRLRVSQQFNTNRAQSYKELSDFVAAASLLMTSLKVHAVRQAQDRHTIAQNYVLPVYSLCVSHGSPSIYTREVDLPKLWKMNFFFYTKFMPTAKFKDPNDGLFVEFDQGIVKESLRTLSTISCPTCPSPLYKLLWVLSVALSAGLVWDASDNIWDEVVQSFGILFVLYAPYVFSMAGGVRSYHLSASNIFWQTYAGGLKQLLLTTWKLMHEVDSAVEPTVQTPLVKLSRRR